MTDAEWTAVRPLLSVPAWLQGRGGQPEGYCHRQMLDAIRYLVAGGISWRAMPADFPGWGRVHAFFRRRREHGLINEFHDRLRGKVRESEGREAEPTAGIIDAQSVRAAATVPAGSRGYDGGKKVPGRKRHIVTDTLGLLLVVAVTAANIGDRDAAAGLPARLRRLHRDITLVWADGGLVDWCRDKLALTLEIVKRTDDMTGFVVLPRRRVAERTSLVPRPRTAASPAHPQSAGSRARARSPAARPASGTTGPGTGEGTVSRSGPVTAVVSAADTARASTSSSRAITRRSSSISAASTPQPTARLPPAAPPPAPGQPPPAPPAFPAPTPPRTPPS
ncbi:IS5 family transposase [Streptomyces sp. NPDC030920]|uniref:IS5 family transposase n=1 Tax=Streptomyces sp. NPDC030920 TaxID=3365308 RepID=UPI0038516CD0